MHSFSLTYKLHVYSAWLILAQMELRGYNRSRRKNLGGHDLCCTNSDVCGERKAIRMLARVASTNNRGYYYLALLEASNGNKTNLHSHMMLGLGPEGTWDDRNCQGLT